MLRSTQPISLHVDRFAHREACRISDRAVQMPVGTVIIDMSNVQEATTSAFARLILLRRELLRHGRDVRLTGLRDQAAKLYSINRLQRVLPRA